MDSGDLSRTFSPLWHRQEKGSKDEWKMKIKNAPNRRDVIKLYKRKWIIDRIKTKSTLTRTEYYWDINNRKWTLKSDNVPNSEFNGLPE